MLKQVSLGLIDLYQKYARAFLPTCCRFSPSCSEYAKQAVSKYGFWRGTLKAGLRICACQPFSKKAGYDPLI